MILIVRCLAIAAGMSCYNATPHGTHLICSDWPTPNVFTCREWNAAMARQVGPTGYYLIPRGAAR